MHVSLGPRVRGDERIDGQPFGRKYFLMLSPSVLNSTLVPRNWRICFLVRLIMPWRLPWWAYITLPDPVTLKRFLAPDLVLILGIWLSLAASASAWQADKCSTLSGCAWCRNRDTCARHRRHGSPDWPGGERPGLWQRAPPNAIGVRGRCWLGIADRKMY